jgi:integrase
MGKVVPLRPAVVSKRFAATRVKFTEQVLRSLPAAATTAYVYDTVAPHLAIRIAPSGVRTFVVVKKFNGKSQRITLGRFPGLRLDEARQAARGLLGELALGKNPIAARKEARARKTSLNDIWPAYLAHLKRRNRTWKRDRERWENHVRPAIGRKALHDMTRADCQALVNSVGTKHTIAANRIAAFLSALFNFAVRSGQTMTNPAKGITRFRETARSRILQSHELPALLDAIRAEPEPWASVFQMLFYTGARRGTVAGMRWDDIDLSAALWTIPADAAKNKTATPVPLTAPAVALLYQRLAQRAGEQWVFPSPTGRSHLIGLPKVWARILKRAGVTNLRIHDILRSVGTALARAGASPHVIAKGLGHRSIASAKAYVQLTGEDARSAMTLAVDALTSRG